jgi:hypothetical protein
VCSKLVGTHLSYIVNEVYEYLSGTLSSVDIINLSAENDYVISRELSKPNKTIIVFLRVMVSHTPDITTLI